VRRAIVTHRRDFIAVIALLLAALFVTGYVLKHEPAFTFGNSYYTVDAQFSNASAVTAGQGQTIDIAGVEVGQVGGVRLEGGHAVVQMNLFKRYAPVYRNATVLLRPRTPLKDMYLELYPGTPDAGALPAGATLPVGATNPTVDFSEILSSLDSDTRDYLLLLLAGGAQAFRDRGAGGEAPSPGAVSHLRGLFQRFAPLNRDTRTFTRLLAERRQNIRSAIHGLEQVTTSLGSVQGQLTSLIDSSNTNFRAIASQATQLQSALTLLPGTLHASAVTFHKLRGFGQASAASARRLLPWARALAPALVAVRPLFRQTTPVIRTQLRPFSVAVQPVARILRPAAAALARATPHLARSFQVLNALFNTLAYKPRGAGQSYLFWGSWLSHIAASLTSQQDAQGPILRGTFMAACSELQLFEVTLVQSTPSIANLLALLNAPDFSTLPGAKNGNCPVG
jgi:phospholipid/cholesterol/gamma-HCH transport system substrate-binding protein